MPSLEGYLPALFLEHILTFELMHRYNLRRFVWSLWLEPQGKSKICNPMDFIWIPVGLSESCSRISQSGFFGQHHGWNAIEGHSFRCSLALRPQRADKRRKVVFRVINSAKKLIQSKVIRDCRNYASSRLAEMHSGWSLCPYLLSRGRFVATFVVARKAAGFALRLLNDCWENPCFLVKAVGGLIGLNTE